MSGYREHGFDPNAYQAQGKPLRPYNWVQWTGVLCALVGIALEAVYLAGQLGWTPKYLSTPSVGFPLVTLAIVLVNSRREPARLEGSEQLQRNRRMLLIAVVVLAAILGFVTILSLKGA